jgi:hypothetical protein
MLDYDEIGKYMVDKITFPTDQTRKIGESSGLYHVNPEDAPTLE